VINIFQDPCFFTFFDIHKHVGLGVCRQLPFYYLRKSEFVFCFSILVTQNFVVILFVEEPWLLIASIKRVIRCLKIIHRSQFKIRSIPAHANVKSVSLVHLTDTLIVEFVPLVAFKLWANEAVIVAAVERTTMDQNSVQMVYIGIPNIVVRFILLRELERL